jgi:stage II sporulation protein P
MKQIRQAGIVVSVKGTTLLKSAVSILLFLFMSFSISGVLTSLNPEYRISSSSVNSAATNITGELLFQLLGWENHYFLEGLPENASSTKLSSALFTMSTNISLDDPRSLLGRELPGFSLFDSKIIVAGEGTNYTNMPIESAPPIEVLKAEREAALQNTEGLEEPPSSGKASTPPMNTGGRKVVYLYFSHNRESFLPYLKGVTDPDMAYHSKINITKVGEKLQSELEAKGIGTIVEKTDIQGNLNKKGWEYSQSYQESRTVVQAALAGNRDLTYLIDIHRDSKRKKNTTIDINGKSYAKIAFVIGAENPNYDKNLKLANELHKLLDKKYGKGLSRGIIESKGKWTNGKFNQDLSENAILIEFGGVDNTFEELNRSAEALADVFSEYYWQAERVNQPVKEEADKN